MNNEQKAQVASPVQTTADELNTEVRELNHSALVDKYIGKPGSAERDIFDADVSATIIGLKIQAARKRSGLTQDELAEKLNTKKAAISRLEKGNHSIRLDTLIKIAEALNLSLKIDLLQK